jgi:hypothetical protein
LVAVTIQALNVYMVGLHFLFMIENFFIHLNTERKAEFITKTGTLLASRINNRYVIELYHFSSYYVEIWYNPIRCQVYKVISFDTDTCFEPYLESISIDLSH